MESRGCATQSPLRESLQLEVDSVLKGAVHILGKICPRSDPDVAHMEYSMDPLKFIYKPLLMCPRQVC